MNQRPLSADELEQLRLRAFMLCLELDRAEERATPEHRAAAMLIARFELFRAKARQ